MSCKLFSGDDRRTTAPTRPASLSNCVVALFRRSAIITDPNFPEALAMALHTLQHLFHSPSRRRGLIAPCLAVVLSMWASAQNTNGRVIGIVTDPQGAAVVGAKVTVSNIGTNVTWNAVTDDKGSYLV